MDGRRFHDHFSDNAAGYARYRLRYPPALFAHLAALAPARRRCWDCATGSGQAALGWAEHFAQVIATDASAEQLARAPAHPRVEFRRALAEESRLEDRSVDLVSAAAAIHWFALERFYAEVRRVSRPGAVLAAWSYGARLEISPRIDPLIERFVEQTLGPYWPRPFRHVQSEYRELRFPFDEIELPTFAIEAQWTVDELLGYLRTWSGVRGYVAARGEDPVQGVGGELAALWGDETRRCVWPLFIRAGRVG